MSCVGTNAACNLVPGFMRACARTTLNVRLLPRSRGTPVEAGALGEYVPREDPGNEVRKPA